MFGWSYRRTLLAIGVVSFLLRASYVIAQTRFAIFDTPFLAGDSRTYLAAASAIAAGHGLSLNGAPTAFVGPVYPLFLSVFAVLGRGALAIGIVQAALGAVTVALTGGITLELASAARRTQRVAEQLALVAALVMCVYPGIILWTGYILTETPFLFLMASSLYLILVAQRRGSARLAVLAGGVAAAAALTRSAYLGTALLVTLLWLAIAFRGRTPKAWLVPALFFAALLVPQVVWTVRNVVELASPIVTVTESGGILYQGNARGSSGGSGGYLDEKDVPPLELPAGLGEVQRDEVYQRQAIADITSDPWAVVRRWPAKLWNMWRPTYEDASLRNGIVSVLTYVPVLLLGLAGAVGLAMHRPLISMTALPLLVILSWALMHMLLVGLIRYRVPAELVLVSATPFGAEWLWRRLAVRRPAGAPA